MVTIPAVSTAIWRKMKRHELPKVTKYYDRVVELQKEIVHCQCHGSARLLSTFSARQEQIGVWPGIGHGGLGAHGVSN